MNFSRWSAVFGIYGNWLASIVVYISCWYVAGIVSDGLVVYCLPSVSFKLASYLFIL
jgi:hypothetical protein